MLMQIIAVFIQAENIWLISACFEILISKHIFIGKKEIKVISYISSLFHTKSFGTFRSVLQNVKSN